tara:strand:- start:55183 stop:55632 length:450 start_codon:yes stop_codon:yes gene_type:complete
MRRPRDSQRSKLYGWERAELKTGRLVQPEDNVPLGEKGAQDLVREIWRDFCPELGVMPRVIVMGNRGRGIAFPTLIKLSSSYATTQARWYVIHELTHSILDRRRHYTDPQVASHGPEFCQLYAELLGRYSSARYAALIRGSMKGAGLKI